MRARSSDAKRRRTVGLIDQSAFEHLCTVLRAGSAHERSAAARQFANYGSLAVEPLCCALRDRSVRVRIAAAKSLAAVGDERAVQPLAEALRAGYGSKRFLARILVIGCGLITVSLLAFGIEYSMGFGPAVIGAAAGVFGYLSIIRTGRLTSSRHCTACVKALSAIAARHPTPAFRVVLSDLKAASHDVAQHLPEARQVARQAAVEIEALTREAMVLPVPSAGTSADQTLPRLAEPASNDTGTLPRTTTR